MDIATPYIKRTARAVPANPRFRAAAGIYQFSGGGAVLRAVSWPLPLIALLACAALAGCGGKPPASGVPPPITGPDGEPARSVTLTLPRVDFSGHVEGDVSLLAHRGKVVAITYFTVWCVPCGEALPRIARLAGELDQLDYIAVSLDDRPRKLIPAFVEYLRLDPDHVELAVADDAHRDGRTPFGPLRAVPVTHLVDRGGRHVETFYGIPPTVYLHRRVLELSERD